MRLSLRIAARRNTASRTVTQPAASQGPAMPCIIRRGLAPQCIAALRSARCRRARQRNTMSGRVPRGSAMQGYATQREIP